MSNDRCLGIIFDGDDTLWLTEPLYDEARSNARAVVAAAGMDGSKWEALERQIDVLNVTTMGYSVERFPESCVQAYEETCRIDHLIPDPLIAGEIRSIARYVFDHDAPLAVGARETLTSLRARGARLALLTKGDPDLQTRRIARSGLIHFFQIVEIVPEKSPEIIRAVVDALDLDVGSAWMVGNSIRSDILPALKAGVRAIWINAHVWEHERTHDNLLDDRVTVLSALSDIPNLLLI